LRRTHHDVKAGILKSCASHGLSISQLLASENLSYKILKPSLEHLISCGLVEYQIDRRRKLVRTTGLGVTAFRAYENAVDMMDGRSVSAPINGSLTDSEKHIGSWNIVIEHKDRTILPRPIMIKP
jgi:predicted transcriptional regulator